VPRGAIPIVNFVDGGLVRPDSRGGTLPAVKVSLIEKIINMGEKFRVDDLYAMYGLLNQCSMHLHCESYGA